jgi:hypothetical protein
MRTSIQIDLETPGESSKEDQLLSEAVSQLTRHNLLPVRRLGPSITEYRALPVI